MAVTILKRFCETTGRLGRFALEGANHLLWPAVCDCCGCPVSADDKRLCRDCWNELLECTAGEYCPSCGKDEDDHEIELRVELSENRLTVSIVDDGIPFNPIGVETPDTELSLEERKIGGLGIHLVRRVMDKVSYQRRIDKNIATLVKRLNTDNK